MSIIFLGKAGDDSYALHNRVFGIAGISPTIIAGTSGGGGTNNRPLVLIEYDTGRRDRN